MSDTRRFNRSIKYFLITIIVISCAGIICLSLAMMHSSGKLGQEIAEQYFAAEEKNAKMYFDVVSMGRLYVDEMAEEDASPQQVKEWMTSFFSKSIESHRIDGYCYFVCYQGKIYADHWMDVAYREVVFGFYENRSGVHAVIKRWTGRGRSPGGNHCGYQSPNGQRRGGQFV